MKCNVFVCDRIAIKRGYCDSHYKWAKLRNFTVIPEYKVGHRYAKADINTNNWTRENLAWVAGFFDGEGTIELTERTIKLSVSQKDSELLYRIKHILNTGTIIENKTICKWISCKTYNNYAILAALFPWFSTKRKEKTKEALIAFKEF